MATIVPLRSVVQLLLASKQSAGAGLLQHLGLSLGVTRVELTDQPALTRSNQSEGLS